jgi:hypothetical protein
LVLEGGTAQARQSTIPQLVDDAMAGIERDDPGLKGVPPKEVTIPRQSQAKPGAFDCEPLRGALFSTWELPCASLAYE